MKASEAALQKFLQGPKQFIIPIYQRTYSWTLRQCQQLWDDMLRVAKDDSVPGHFIGSIVYIEKGLYQIAQVPRLLVIDGQQRLATISLFLAGLAKHLNDASDGGGLTSKQISNYFLFNSEERGDLHYKLLLTQSDKETLISLIEGREPASSASLRMIENYRFFEQQIKECGLPPEKLYQGFAKLIVVDVSLDRNYDNPQLIFESLNSTGLDLSQADLIRNYVLMGLEPDEQDQLYKNHWFSMEQSFGHAKYAERFDRFMRDYLTIKSKAGSIPKIQEVYSSFKSHTHEHGMGIKGLVEDVHNHSKLWVRMSFSAKESDPSLRSLFRDINTLRVEVAYPFLLEVYADYEGGNLSKDDFVKIIKLIESYVFRRAICGIPTNSLNKTFATLSRGVDKTHYLESVQAEFLLRSSQTRFPRDEEFEQEFVVKDSYNFRNRNYLLAKLENHGRKEQVDVEGYTIEHVMPQNPDLPSEWQTELGPPWRDIQGKWLHTIGNLTLTGYNTEYSDRPFKEKRDMKNGFRDSPIRLNRSLAHLEHWNEVEIQNRARELAKLATQIWPIPN
jgi:uncharacterized protein with ParB-like and HNH nuclease domain